MEPPLRATVLDSFARIMDERDWPAHDLLNVAEALDVPLTRLTGDR